MQGGSPVKGAHTADCTPWSVRTADGDTEIAAGPGRWFGGYALLIGCREQLGSLRPEERRAASKAVADYVLAGDLYVVLGRERAEVRRGAVAAVNRSVGREVVSDVWLAFSFAESFE